MAAERAAFKGKARELKARLAATHAGAKHDVATMQEVASRTASLIVSRAVSPTVALTVSLLPPESTTPSATQTSN